MTKIIKFLAQDVKARINSNENRKKKYRINKIKKYTQQKGLIKTPIKLPEKTKGKKSNSK